MLIYLDLMDCDNLRKTEGFSSLEKLGKLGIRRGAEKWNRCQVLAIGIFGGAVGIWMCEAEEHTGNGAADKAST